MLISHRTEIYSSTRGYFSIRDLREVLPQPLFYKGEISIRGKEMVFPGRHEVAMWIAGEPSDELYRNL